jgi:hypothetical protein
MRLRIDTDGHLYVYQANESAFTDGATITIESFTVQYEL